MRGKVPRQSLLLTVILLAGAAALLYQAGRPYGKVYESGVLETIARNYDREGIFRLRFLPTLNLIGGRPNYYLNHPPLVMVQLGLFYSLLGDSELASRVNMITWALLSLLLFFLIIRQEISLKAATFSALVMALLPVFFYYGRIVNFESFTLFASLLTIWLFIKALDSDGNIYLYAFFVSVAIGSLSDWPFYPVLPGLVAYSLIRRRGLKTAVVGLAIGALVLAGLLAAYNHLVTGSTANGENPLNVFRGLRPYLREGALTSYWSSGEFWSRISNRITRCFTHLIPFIAVGGAIIGFRTGSRKIKSLALLFLISGSALIIADPSGPFWHDWGFYPLIPAAAFLSALFILKIHPVFRLGLLAALAVLSFRQFRDFHGQSSLRNYHLGIAIASVATDSDILYSPRGIPIAYYADMPNQFLWPGPPFTQFIENHQPDFIVIGVDPIDWFISLDRERLHSFLLKHHYRLIYRDLPLELWKKSNPAADIFLLAELISPEDIEYGWETGLAATKDSAFFTISTEIDAMETRVLSLPRLKIPPDRIISGYFRPVFSHNSPNQYLEIFLTAWDGEEETVLLARRAAPDPNSETENWIHFQQELSRFVGKSISFKFRATLISEDGNSRSRISWGNPGLLSFSAPGRDLHRREGNWTGSRAPIR